MLARAGYERRRVEEGYFAILSMFDFSRPLQDQDALSTLIGIVESGIEMARQGSSLYSSMLTPAETILTSLEIRRSQIATGEIPRFHRTSLF